MFVTPEQLEEFTGKKRPSAQARFLKARGLVFIPRDDGTVALRQDELDRHTLSKAPARRPRWQPDLSVLDKAG